MQSRADTLSFGWLRLAAVVTLLSLGALWSACGSAVEPSVSLAAGHAVDSEKLTLVMRHLERVESAILPQEIDARREQLRRREQIGELADAIARSADDIPSVLDDVEIPPAYREEFVRLAKDLGDRARELHVAAPRSTIVDLQGQLQTLRASCKACHTRFRVLPMVR